MSYFGESAKTYHGIANHEQLEADLLLFYLFLVAHPKTKPPPLLSLHRLPGPSLGGPIVRGPLSSHIPYGGPGVPRGPLLHPPPVFHPGPRGPTRGAPPTLKSARPPLLSSPGWSLVSFGVFFFLFLNFCPKVVFFASLFSQVLLFFVRVSPGIRK